MKSALPQTDQNTRCLDVLSHRDTSDTQSDIMRSARGEISQSEVCALLSSHDLNNACSLIQYQRRKSKAGRNTEYECKRKR